MNRLGRDDPQDAFSLLCVSLQAIRDSLPPPEASLLGSHLPLLLSGQYLEGLRPLKLVAPEDGGENFLRAVRRRAPDIGFDAAEVAAAVLALLANRVERKYCQEIFDALPNEILELRNHGVGSPDSCSKKPDDPCNS